MGSGLKVTFLEPLPRGGAERGAGGTRGVDSLAGDAIARKTESFAATLVLPALGGGEFR